ncbi:peptide chain release factor N(5)-glutamine methyltransferase [Candidatus Peregrinibacteria bacterium]|nr:peptide chain release factor N(5)-glutamine methyltransferase [Candidatus Peregrinibacteria bacterium]
MTIKEVLQIGKIFAQEKIDDLALEVLLAHTLRKDKEYLFAHLEDDVSHDRIEQYTGLVKRHFNGEPVAYIIGEKEFYGRKLYVDERVLIPRPETEYLVDKTALLLKNHHKDTPSRVLDLGTGSGNIAIAIADIVPNVQVTACDVSEDALMVAKKNVKRYNLEGAISLVHSDLLQNIKEEAYDVMVANLPYIGLESNHFVSRETKNYEPHTALFGGTDGLALYEEFFTQLCQWRKKPRYIMGEIGFLQAKPISIIINQFFPESVLTIEKDLTGLDRYFLINLL